MPGFDYGRMQATASRLLSRFAQGTVELVRTIPGEPAPETPWLPGEASTETETLSATVAAVSAADASAEYMAGSTITTSDLVVTCAVPATKPSMGDTVRIDDAVYVIKKIVQMPAAGVAVAYKLFVGGGAAQADVVVPPGDGPSFVFSLPANSQYIALLEDI